MADEKEAPFDAQAEWDRLEAEDTALRGGDPLPEQAAAGAEIDAKQEGAKEESKPEDPLETIRKTLAQYQEQNTKQFRDLGGRFGSLAQRMDKVSSEVTAAKAAAIPGGPSHAEIDRASKTPEKWEKLKTEWADSGLTDAIEEYVAHTRPAQQQAMPDFEKLVSERVATATQSQAQELAEMRGMVIDMQMTAVHPDWKTTVASPAFNEWRQAQPEYIQNLARSPKSTDAIEMLNLYRSTVKPTGKTAEEQAQANKQRLASAVNPAKTEVSARKLVSEDEMTPSQLFDHLTKQDTERRKRAALRN